MTKTQSRSNSHSSAQLQPQEPGMKFKIGDRVGIKSTHPIFPSVNCTISAFPSPDAAIVEFESGSRERLLLEYLDLLGQENICNSSTASFDIIEALTPDEERERHRLELKVGRAFYEAGAALRQLRDLRLYRNTHQTFEQYCRSRFAFTRQSANYLIAGAGVFENLTTTGCQILPTSERQVRYLNQLEPTVQPEAWQEAVAIADGKVPTSPIVKGVVERIKAKPLYLASDYCSLGEVFFLTRLHGEERKYNGCWAIALEVENRFTVKAATYKGVLEVKQENIKQIDCEQTQAEIRDIHQRLTQLTKCQLDPIDEAQIEILCRRPWFTDRQKQALSAIEEVYQVKVKP